MNVRPRESRFVWGCARSRDQLRWRNTRVTKPVTYIYIYISIVTNEEGLSSFDLGHQADED